ncbi:MAG: response regulator, partial [Pseudomonadota bacterium]
MRVAVIEDDGATRQAICQAIEVEFDLQLVGSAATYREAEQLLQTIDVDLVLLDLQLDEQPAFNLIPMARQ